MGGGWLLGKAGVGHLVTHAGEALSHSSSHALAGSGLPSQVA